MSDIYEHIAARIFTNPDLGSADAYVRGVRLAADVAAILNGADLASATWALGHLVANLLTRSPHLLRASHDFELIVAVLADAGKDRRLKAVIDDMKADMKSKGDDKKAEWQQVEAALVAAHNPAAQRYIAAVEAASTELAEAVVEAARDILSARDELVADRATRTN
jgi:hypothetical protein